MDEKTESPKLQLYCLKCDMILGEWFKPPEGKISEYELWLQARFVFGRPKKLNLREAHELR